MSDYISRQAAWDISSKLHSGYITIEQDQMLERLDEMIDDIPAADVVEVVRCVDCRYWQNYNDVMVCGLTNAMMSVSDYCSYGERTGKC